MSNRIVSRSIAALVALCLGLAACGGDDDADTGATSTTTASDAGSGVDGTDDTGTDDTGTDDTGTDGPSTTSGGDPEVPEVSDDERPYVDALATGQDSDFSEAQDECLAAEIVQAIGVENFEEAGVTPGDLENDQNDAMRTVGGVLSRSEAEEIADIVIGTECIDYAAFISQSFMATDSTEEEADCVRDGILDVSGVRDALVENVLGNQDANPFENEATVTDLRELLEGCGIDTAGMLPDEASGS